MPGIGKTQLLLRYAKVYWDQHRYTRIFWTSATTVEKISQGLTGILDLIDHDGRYLQDQAAKLTAARHWLEQPDSDDWLLVVDNVHIDTLGILRTHLPLRNKRGHILLTTRTAKVAEALANVAGEHHPTLKLQVLALRETANLLFEDAGVDAEILTPILLGQAEELVKRVGLLPLAVVQTASFMKQTHTTIDAMLELYKNERKIEVSSIR
jgi:hypothetical protein